MKTKLLTLLIILGAFGSTDLLAQETTRQFPRQGENAQPRAQERPQPRPQPRLQRGQQGERQRPQRGQQDAQQRPSREQMREHLVQRFDKDGDGRLNQEEGQAARKAMQARRQEMQNSRRGNQAPNRGDEIRSRRGQNEGLRGRRPQNQSEGTGRPERDQREELLQRRGQRQNSQGQGVERFPHNGEGRGENQQGASQEERRVRILQRFDANQDGKLDQHERVALQEAMQKRRAEMQRQEPNSTRGARQERGRQGRENADAPRSGRRQFPR